MNELEAGKEDDEMRDNEGVLKNPIGPREDDEEKIPSPPHQTTTDPDEGKRERRRTTTAQGDEPPSEDDAMDDNTDTNPDEHDEPADTNRPDQDSGSGAPIQEEQPEFDGRGVTPPQGTTLYTASRSPRTCLKGA